MKKEIVQTVFLMRNKIMNYSWGSSDFISELTGQKNPEKQPQAELWMGAHEKAPSTIELSGSLVDLDQLIKTNPQMILGNQLSSQCHDFPYLFKILSSKQPLSIQVHPNKEQAKIGYQDEVSRQLPLDAKIRNYKDNNHKPEMMLALTPFSALAGIRSFEEIAEIVEFLRLTDKIEEFRSLVTNLSTESIREFILWLLSQKGRSKQKIRHNILRAAFLRKGCDHPAAFAINWICRIDEYFPEDIGVFAPLIMNTIQLQPGEAIFMDSGIMHAYLQGSGLEIMANSDNVLRCALTPKHVDIKELFKIASFAPSEPHYIRPRLEGIEEMYYSPAKEFLLSRIQVKGSYTLKDVRTPQIVLNLQDAVELIPGKGNSLTLGKGGSALLIPGAGSCQIKGNTTIYRTRSNLA